MPLEDADSAAAAARARTSERRQPAAPAQPQPGADLCQHTPACRSLGANPQPPKPALIQARRYAEKEAGTIPGASSSSSSAPQAVGLPGG